jgi:hypothetical protein
MLVENSQPIDMVCAARGVIGSRIRENICRSGIMFQLRLNPEDRRVAFTPPIPCYKEKVASISLRRLEHEKKTA